MYKSISFQPTGTWTYIYWLLEQWNADLYSSMLSTTDWMLFTMYLSSNIAQFGWMRNTFLQRWVWIYKNQVYIISPWNALPSIWCLKQNVEKTSQLFSLCLFHWKKKFQIATQAVSFSIFYLKKKYYRWCWLMFCKNCFGCKIATDSFYLEQ